MTPNFLRVNLIAEIMVVSCIWMIVVDGFRVDKKGGASRSSRRQAVSSIEVSPSTDTTNAPTRPTTAKVFADPRNRQNQQNNKNGKIFRFAPQQTPKRHFGGQQNKRPNIDPKNSQNLRPNSDIAEAQKIDPTNAQKSVFYDLFMCVVGAMMGSAGVLGVVGVLIRILGAQNFEEIVMRVVTLNGLVASPTQRRRRCAFTRKSNRAVKQHKNDYAHHGGGTQNKNVRSAGFWSTGKQNEVNNAGSSSEESSVATPLSQTSSEASYVRRVREWDVLTPYTPCWRRESYHPHHYYCRSP